jgi:ubiquitin-conjugating enzyme E2 variant
MLLAVYLITGAVSWRWWFVAILGGNANIVHQWAHMFPNEKPAVVNWLQKVGVIQRPHNHARHHTKPETRAYCTYTPWLNPFLDRIRFWFTIEAILARVNIYTTDRIDG